MATTRPTTRPTFADHLRLMPRYFSTWVVFLISSAAAYWLQMSPDDQQAVLEALPALRLVAPALGFVAFVIARGIPQFPPPDDPGAGAER